jgi:hypothetical protein
MRKLLLVLVLVVDLCGAALGAVPCIELRNAI